MPKPPPPLSRHLTPLFDDLWIMDFPLRLAGLHLGRRVTIIRLSQGELVIHSTAQFSEADTESIRKLGTPLALVEGTLMHDTYAKIGRAAFPEVPYFVPDATLPWCKGARSLKELSAVCRNEILVHPIMGIPRMREHVLLHPASRTMVVCDLIFNLQPPQPWWTSFVFTYLNRCLGRPGITPLFRLAIRNRKSFCASLAVLAADQGYDHLIPGHGNILLQSGRKILQGEVNRLQKSIGK